MSILGVCVTVCVVWSICHSAEVSFEGDGHLLLHHKINLRTFSVRFCFLTGSVRGVILQGRSEEFPLENLSVSINPFGLKLSICINKQPMEGYINGRFNDGSWHTIDIFGQEGNLTMMTENKLQLALPLNGLEPNKLIILDRISLSVPDSDNFFRFRGCIKNVMINNLDVLNLAKAKLLKTEMIQMKWSCQMSLFTNNWMYPISMESESSALTFYSRNILSPDLLIQFDYKTLSTNCTLFRLHLDGGDLLFQIAESQIKVSLSKPNVIVYESNFHQGHWKTVEIKISKEFLVLSLNSDIIFSNFIGEKTISEIFLEFGMVKNAIADSDMTKCTRSMQGCLRNVFLNHEPFGISNASSSYLVSSGCLLTFHCIFSSCSNNKDCSFSKNRNAFCQGFSNRHSHEIQKVPVNYSYLLEPGKIITHPLELQEHKPSQIRVRDIIGSFLWKMYSNVFILTQLQVKSSPLLFTNKSNSGNDIRISWSSNYIENDEVFCCVSQLKSPLKKNFVIVFMISLNTILMNKTRYVPPSPLVDGLYIQMNVTVASESSPLVLEFPKGDIIMTLYPVTVIDRHIISCDEKTFILFTPFPKDILFGHFILRRNLSYSNISNVFPLKVKCLDIIHGNLLLKTVSQCSFLIRASKRNTTSNPSVLSFVPMFNPEISIRNTGLSCPLFSKTSILPSQLNVRIFGVKSTDIYFFLNNTEPDESAVEIFDVKRDTWRKSIRFTQAEINRGFVRYVAEKDDEPAFHLAYAYLTISIFVEAKVVREIVTLIQISKLEILKVINWGLVVNKTLERSTVITPEYLNVVFKHDLVLSRSLKEIVFQLEDVPHFGVLFNNETKKEISNFTLRDLRKKKIVYVLKRNIGPHEVAIMEELRFKVGFKIPIMEHVKFAILIVRNKRSPDLIVHKSFKLLSIGSNNYKITMENLWLSSDHCFAFTMSILLPPKYGKFVRKFDYFTKEDIIEGQVVYHHENLDQLEDRFIFQVKCQNGNYSMSIVEEFSIRLETKNNFPPGKESLENFYIDYITPEVLSPFLFHFKDQENDRPLVYKRFCYSGAFPPCLCKPNSLVIIEKNKNVDVFTDEELMNYGIEIKNMGLMEESLCFTISDGTFNTLSITNVFVDNLLGLKVPSYQELKILVSQSTSSVFFHVVFELSISSIFRTFYFILITPPSFGYLSTINEDYIQKGDILSLYDLIESKILYTLTTDISEDIVDTVNIQIRSTLNNETYDVEVAIVSHLVDKILATGEIINDVLPVESGTLTVLIWNDKSRLDNRLLSSRSSTAQDKSQIIYNIIQLPKYGSLEYRRTSLVMKDIKRFSEQDLENGWIFYSCKICKSQTITVDENINKFFSDKDSDFYPQDSFYYELEIPHNRLSRQWRFNIVFSNILLVIESSPLNVEVHTNASLRFLDLRMSTSFYFNDRHILYNVTWSSIIFKVISDPREGAIYSKRLNRSIHSFLYEDINRDEVYYKHLRDSSEYEDSFEAMAYMVQPFQDDLRGNGNLVPVISEPLKIQIRIMETKPRIKLVHLRPLHSWSSSRILISNEHLSSVYQSKKYSDEDLREKLGENIVYNVFSPVRGFLARLDHPTVDIYSFSQRDINMNYIYFVSTGNRGIKRFGGFRFHVSVKGNRNIPPIVGKKFKIILYPVKFSVHKSVMLQLSSLRVCQPITKEHLKAELVPPNAHLPTVTVLYRITRLPVCSNIYKKSYNPHYKSSRFLMLKVNDIFSQNQVEEQFICINISTSCRRDHFKDSFQLMIVTKEYYLYDLHLIPLKIFFSFHNINHYNQNLFFQPLSWTLNETSAIIISSDRFRMNDNFRSSFNNPSFKLVRQSIHGYLCLKNIQMHLNSSFDSLDLQNSLVKYIANPVKTVGLVFDTIDLELFFNNEGPSSYSKQFLRLSFTIFQRQRNMKMNISCVKGSMITLSKSIFKILSENVNLLSKLYFKIRKGPKFGHVMVQSKSSASIFAEWPVLILGSEIINKLLHYKNTNIEADSDLIEMDLYYLDTPSTVVQRYRIKVNLIPAQLELRLNPINMFQCHRTKTISTSYLNISSNVLLSDSNYIKINVTLSPLYGKILSDLVPVTRFSFADVLKARISYFQTDQMRSSDRFKLTFSASSSKGVVQTGLMVVNVIPKIDIRPAFVVIGGKLTITTQYIQAKPLIQCSGSYVLFVVQNKYLKYGELSKERQTGDNSFTNKDIDSHKLIYESFSFFQKEFDDELIQKNHRSFMVEEINLLVSTPNSSLLIQPSILTFTIHLASREFLDTFLSSSNLSNLSVVESRSTHLKKNDISYYSGVKEYFSISASFFIVLSILSVVSIFVIIWFSVRHKDFSRHSLLSSLRHLSRKRETTNIRFKDNQDTDQCLAMFNNRFFVDSGDELIQKTDDIMKWKKQTYPNVEGEVDEVDTTPLSEVNVFKF